MVTGVNGITGAITITSGSNVVITQSGKTITIASSGGGGTNVLATSSVTGVASFRAADFDVSPTGSVSLMISNGLSVTGNINATGSINANSGFTVGSVSINSRTTGYTLVASDNGKIVTVNSTSPVTLTAGTDVGFTGFSCVVMQLGLGQVTIAGSSTTVNSYSGTKISGQFAAATLFCYASNTFAAIGSLTS